MSEDTTTETSEDAPRPRPRRKLMIIAGAVVLTVAAGGGAAFFLGAIPGLGSEANSELDGEHAGVDEVLAFYELPEIVIRLEGGQGPYLKIATVLDLSSPDYLEEVQAVEPRLVDVLQTYLVELDADDIRGSAGVSRVRQELLRRVNDTIPHAARDILFKTLILQ